MKDNLFIIIITYNGIQWIDKCLKSCYGYKIIVVDNNSTDNTVSFIKKKYPSVVILEQTQNLGFGNANNLGLNYALKRGGDFFLLLNQDSYLKDNTLEKLINQLNDNPEYGIVSPIHLATSEVSMDLQFQSYLIPSKSRLFHNDMFIKQTANSIYEIDFVNAAIWLLSKETLRRVGGFNPYFFHYGEDNDYVNRCKYKGLKVGIVPNCFAIHDREQKFRKTSEIDIDNYFKIKIMDPNQDKSLESIVFIAFKLTIKFFFKLNFKTSKYYLISTLKILKDAKKITAIREQVLSDNFSFLKY